MSDKVELRVDWCSYEAAKYAVEHWHYSETMPSGKLVKIGVWENGEFIGCIVFGRGANNNIGSPYGLEQIEVCELVRIALNFHVSPVSKIAVAAIEKLKLQSKNLRLIVSYADPLQGHLGKVYQAMNWIYTGISQAQAEVMHNGKIMHKRTANALFGTIKGMEKSPVMWKYKYLYPLDRAMRKQILPLAQPYPKRAGEVSDGDTSGDQPEGAGSIPAARSISNHSISKESGGESGQ